MTPPHRLPLEVLERILLFALGGDAPLGTPSTCVPVTPPVSTSHLLRVSKDVQALALPHYWRSITILHSHDWITLWHPETGLLSGEQGLERASFVKEIRINTSATARMPVDIARIRTSHEDRIHPTFLLLPLATVPLPRLKHVCFFLRGSDWKPVEGAPECLPREDLLVDLAAERSGKVTAGDALLKSIMLEFEEYDRDDNWAEELRADGLEEDSDEWADAVYAKEQEFCWGEILQLDWYDPEQRELDREREFRLASLLALPRDDLETVRVRADSELLRSGGGPGLSLKLQKLGPHQDQKRPLCVYPSVTGMEGKDFVQQYKLVRLRDAPALDFVDVPVSVREDLVSVLEGRLSAGITLAGCRWVEEDGSLTAFRQP